MINEPTSKENHNPYHLFLILILLILSEDLLLVIQKIAGIGNQNKDEFNTLPALRKEKKVKEEKNND